MKNLLFILVVLTIGCSLTPTVDDPQFEKEYLIPFKQKAESYGVKLHTYSASIVYVDSLFHEGQWAAGLADWESQTITFNTSHPYWNSEAREVLVYHELAHYYMSKMHIDEECSCTIPFSIMSLWNDNLSEEQFTYWTSGAWREMEEYYMRELFLGSHVWNEYPGHEDIISHEIEKPCQR